MCRLAPLLAVAGLASASASAQLPDVKCGQLRCKANEYCSPDTNRCAPCDVICNRTHHNYDSGLCVQECQNYLLDLRYLHQGDAEGSLKLQAVQRQAQAALIISVVSLALLALVLIIVCRGRYSWAYLKKKFQPTKNRVNNHPAGLTHHNPHAEMIRPKPETKLEIRSPDRPQALNVRDLDTRTSHADRSQGAMTPKTVSTALSNRHPAEDSTLDFAYDNRALNVTPPDRF
ncbi:protein grindelwald [Amyelois transitella]|uniref:protein grindelwald n=1 Tax=Amyelois transitella TaxID=680683 RepID=UPI00067AEA3A|nr:protein grindelwald [Amyelois transitella]